MALAAACVLSGSPFACSSSNQLSGPGGPCTLVTDCQDGLVCCNAGKSAPTCASAVTCLLPPGTMLVDGATPPVGDDQGEGGAGEPDAPISSPDATQQDTGAQNKPDAGTPPDAATPPVVDSGTPQDAGTPVEAASPPPDDSGSGD